MEIKNETTEQAVERLRAEIAAAGEDAKDRIDQRTQDAIAALADRSQGERTLADGLGPLLDRAAAIYVATHTVEDYDGVNGRNGRVTMGSLSITSGDWPTSVHLADRVPRPNKLTVPKGTYRFYVIVEPVE